MQRISMNTTIIIGGFELLYRSNGITRFKDTKEMVFTYCIDNIKNISYLDKLHTVIYLVKDDILYLSNGYICISVIKFPECKCENKYYKYEYICNICKDEYGYILKGNNEGYLDLASKSKYWRTIYGKLKGKQEYINIVTNKKVIKTIFNEYIDECLYLSFCSGRGYEYDSSGGLHIRTHNIKDINYKSPIIKPYSHISMCNCPNCKEGYKQCSILSDVNDILDEKCKKQIIAFILSFRISGLILPTELVLVISNWLMYQQGFELEYTSGPIVPYMLVSLMNKDKIIKEITIRSTIYNDDFKECKQRDTYKKLLSAISSTINARHVNKLARNTLKNITKLCNKDYDDDIEKYRILVEEIDKIRKLCRINGNYKMSIKPIVDKPWDLLKDRITS